MCTHCFVLGFHHHNRSTRLILCGNECVEIVAGVVDEQNRGCVSVAGALYNVQERAATAFDQGNFACAIETQSLSYTGYTCVLTYVR